MVCCHARILAETSSPASVITHPSQEDYGLGAPSPLLCRLPPLFGRATKCPRSLRKQRKQPAGCFRKQQNHPLETTVTTVTTRGLWPLWPLFLFCFLAPPKHPPPLMISIRLPFAIDGFERRAEYRSSSSPIVWERSWLCCCGQVAIRGRFSIVFGRRFFRRFLPNPWCIIDVASSIRRGKKSLLRTTDLITRL